MYNVLYIKGCCTFFEFIFISVLWAFDSLGPEDFKNISIFSELYFSHIEIINSNIEWFFNNHENELNAGRKQGVKFRKGWFFACQLYNILKNAFDIWVRSVSFEKIQTVLKSPGLGLSNAHRTGILLSLCLEIERKKRRTLMNILRSIELLRIYTVCILYSV